MIATIYLTNTFFLVNQLYFKDLIHKIGNTLKHLTDILNEIITQN